MRSRTWQAAEPWVGRLPLPPTSSSNAVWPLAVPGIGFTYSPIQRRPRYVGIVGDQAVKAVDLRVIAVVVALAVALGSVMAWLMFR
jgi:hypothetical protein